MKKIIFITLLLLMTQEFGKCFSQILFNEKRIYILDVTASMIGKGNKHSKNIFGDIKKQLSCAVKDIETPNTEVVIVPFTNKPHNIISGNTNNADSLVRAIENIDIRSGDTNIADAWATGIQQVDTTKINYIFLLTDGLHNCGVEKEEFYNRLHSWDSISYGKYLFAFYFMLSDDAIEQDIVRIADTTRNMWAIHSLNVNTTFLITDMKQSANIYEDHRVTIKFISNHSFIFAKDISFSIEASENPYYQISNQNLYFKNRYICFDINEKFRKKDMPVEYDLNLSFKYDKESHPLLFFIPETINFHVVNRGIRTMTLKTFNTDEL